jgi:hypothetical protein
VLCRRNFAAVPVKINANERQVRLTDAPYNASKRTFEMIINGAPSDTILRRGPGLDAVIDDFLPRAIDLFIFAGLPSEMFFAASLIEQLFQQTGCLGLRHCFLNPHSSPSNKKPGGCVKPAGCVMRAAVKDRHGTMCIVMKPSFLVVHIPHTTHSTHNYI